jgi:hypothetical protein
VKTLIPLLILGVLLIVTGACVFAATRYKGQHRNPFPSDITDPYTALQSVTLSTDSSSEEPTGYHLHLANKYSMIPPPTMFQSHDPFQPMILLGADMIDPHPSMRYQIERFEADMQALTIHVETL